MLEEWKIDKELYTSTESDYEQTPYDESYMSLEERKENILSHPLPFVGQVETVEASTEFNRLPIGLHFNPITGALIGYNVCDAAKVGTPDVYSNTARMKYVSMDPAKEIWVGDADTGKIIPIAENPVVVNEYEVNAWCHNRIQRVYKHFHQLNILRKTVLAIVDKIGLTEEEAPILTELNDLQEFVEKMRANNERYIAEYIASPAFNYYTKDEWDKLEEDRRAGEIGTLLPSLNQITIQGKWESIAE